MDDDKGSTSDLNANVFNEQTVEDQQPPPPLEVTDSDPDQSAKESHAPKSESEVPDVPESASAEEYKTMKVGEAKTKIDEEGQLTDQTEQRQKHPQGKVNTGFDGAGDGEGNRGERESNKRKRGMRRIEPPTQEEMDMIRSEDSEEIDRSSSGEGAKKRLIPEEGGTQQYRTFPQPAEDETRITETGACCGLPTILLRVYTSHGLSAWGDRMWSFAVGLFLIVLYPTSLQLSAAYGLSTSLIVILFGEMVGRWVDETARLKAARTALVIQNVAVAVSAALIVVTFLYEDIIDTYIALMYAGIITAAVVANLASTAQKITMEKDWIVVISNNDNDKLAAMNAVFRSLDLTTFILAPVFVGQIMSFASNTVAAIVIATWNLVSLMLEYYLLHALYKTIPALASKRVKPSETRKSLIGKLKDFLEGWSTFFHQESRFAGLGLAFLYMTVLGFDSITVGYSYSQGVSESILGGVTAVGALFGIFGSISYPFLRSKIGLERTGLMGFLSLVLSLCLCVASVFIPGSPFDISSLKYIGNISGANSVTNSTDVIAEEELPVPKYLSISLLLTGVVFARFGLWVSDLSVTQITQECVHESIRGVVGGVQNSLNMIMDMLKFVLVILIPLPQQFGFLVLLSFGSICLGWVFYAVYSREKRGHIMPFHNRIRFFEEEQTNDDKTEES